LLEDARTRVAELETQVLDSKLEIDSLKASPVVSDEIDCADCSAFLADLTDFREKYASKCEELDVLRVELAELQSRPTFLGACTSCPSLHEKIVELRSHIVSLEADLKVPIPTSCSTCELHAMKNLELAQCVNILQDENNKLREVLSWLAGQEPQLGMMIASCKRFDGWVWDSIRLVRAVVREKGNSGMFQLHVNPHPRTSLHPSQTSRLNREKNRARRKVRILVRSLVKSLIPSLSLDQFGSIVTFVERMVTRESFASKGSERRELRRSGLTRTSTTLPMVYLSLVCSCPGPRRV
jgi:hypothetical protein